MREDRQLEIIVNIIKGYDSKEQLSRYLKDYFKANPQMGSRDRKRTADFVFNFFRIGKAIPQRNIEERLAVANYICSESLTPLLEYCLQQFLKPIEANIGTTVSEKINAVQA